MTLRQKLDQRRQNSADTRLGNSSNDDAGSGSCNADAYHVARAGDHAVNQFIEALIERAGLRLSAEPRKEGALGQQDEYHEGRRPEGRQGWGQSFHHQAPNQHENGQQEVQPGFDRWSGFRKPHNGFIRIVEFQVGIG